VKGRDQGAGDSVGRSKAAVSVLVCTNDCEICPHGTCKRFQLNAPGLGQIVIAVKILVQFAAPDRLNIINSVFIPSHARRYLPQCHDGTAKVYIFARQVESQGAQQLWQGGLQLQVQQPG